MSKQPNVYIDSAKDVTWGSDTTPDDDVYRGMPQEVIQILGFNPVGKGDRMEKASIALVVVPGQLSKAKKGGKHPAGLSKVSASGETNNPSAGHRERMKFAKMAMERMLGACKPESPKEHQPKRVQGREAPKAPYSGYATKVSG